MDIQEHLDRFYFQNGPCCAGCDWWNWQNSLTGECQKSAPISGEERWAMLDITGCSLPFDAGHIITKRDHHCGGFNDVFDWPSLPLAYKKRVGAPLFSSKETK